MKRFLGVWFLYHNAVAFVSLFELSQDINCFNNSNQQNLSSLIALTFTFLWTHEIFFFLFPVMWKHPFQENHKTNRIAKNFNIKVLHCGFTLFKKNSPNLVSGLFWIGKIFRMGECSSNLKLQSKFNQCESNIPQYSLSIALEISEN